MKSKTRVEKNKSSVQQLSKIVKLDFITRKKMSRKYCVDCGSELSSQRMLSLIKVPNNFRLSIFYCNKCETRTGKTKLIAVIRRTLQQDKHVEQIRTYVFEIF